MDQHELLLLGSGTTSNEAFHHEVNRWFQDVHELHQATLKLKLRALHLVKLLVHDVAAYRPTTMQMNQGIISARCLTSIVPWTPSSWEKWCSELLESGKARTAIRANVSKANVPVTDQKKQQSSLVRKLIKKKAATKPKRSRLNRHRTVLTQNKKGKLVGTGRNVSRKPAASRA